MSEILQGMGGTPSEEDKKKLLQMATSGGGGNPSFENDIQAGQSGNASAPLADYLNKTGGGPTIDYEYKPYEMPPVTGNGEGGGSYDGVTGGEDYSDLLTPSGTPMPGHPNYEAWMSDGGGDGAYNEAGEWTGSGSGNENHTGNIGGYTSWGDMFDGGGAGTSTTCSSIISSRLGKSGTFGSGGNSSGSVPGSGMWSTPSLTKSLSFKEVFSAIGIVNCSIALAA